MLVEPASIAPPLPPALLPQKVTLFRFEEPWHFIPPPPPPALLPEKAPLFMLIVGVPLLEWSSIPPPLLAALFLEKVTLFVISELFATQNMPPPYTPELLPTKVKLLRFAMVGLRVL